jgi:hypothetical protein
MLLKNIIMQKITYTISREQKKMIPQKIMIHYEVPTHLRYLLGSHSGKLCKMRPYALYCLAVRGILCTYAGFLLVLLFGPEDAGSVFLRNVLLPLNFSATTQKNTLQLYFILVYGWCILRAIDVLKNIHILIFILKTFRRLDYLILQATETESSPKRHFK